MEQAPTFSIRNRVIPIFSVAIIAGLLGVLAYALYSPSGSGLGANGRVNSVGKLITFGDRPAPDFTLSTFDGAELSLDQFRGKIVVINFWASWCPPCEEEAPTLAEFGRAIDQNQVVLLGVDVWDRESDARQFLEDHGVAFPNGIDQNGSIAVDYGVAGVPETFFIGPDGTLLGKYTGPVKSAEQINGFIEELTRGA